MNVLTNKEMREADAYTIKELGVPSLLLMERAGEALSKEAQKTVEKGKIVCVCGGGNNGGDGFVCARLLKEAGKDVEVLFCARKTSADCQENKDRWEALGGQVSAVFKEKKYALIVDCLFGTGFRGRIDGEEKQIVLKMNEYKKRGAYVLSADIPSGVNGDNGLVESVAVEADKTLCIGEMKVGVLLNDGKDYAGDIQVADIGIKLPQTNYASRIDKEKVASLLPRRKNNSHKGSFGKAAIVAGSKEYTGAAYLATAACLRSGAGYTTLFTAENTLSHFFLRLPEALLKALSGGDTVLFKEAEWEQLLSYDSIAYGMGMGISDSVAMGAKYLLERYEGKLILDADGLNSLAKYEKGNLEKIFSRKKCDVLITPHVKEFSRLLGESVAEILQEGIQSPLSFAKAHRINVLLKGATTVITDGEKVFLNDKGNSGQAKGGSGDVLSGLLAGLCAQGMSCFDSGVIAAYLAGKAAEIGAKKHSAYALKASDCVDCLGEAFLSVLD